MKYILLCSLGPISILMLLISSACVQTPQSEEKVKSEVRREDTTSITVGTKRLAIKRIGPVPVIDHRSRLQCVNERYCWITSFDKTWKSVDGGGTWSLAYTTHSQEVGRSEVYISERTGWRWHWGGYYKTEDGGLSWVKQPPTPLDDPDGTLRAMCFINGGQMIWAAGNIYTAAQRGEDELRGGYTSSDGKLASRPVIYLSTDGGKTWEKKLSVRNVAGWVSKIEFTSPSHGVAIGEGGIWVTYNGKDWEEAMQNPKCADQEYLGNIYEKKWVDFFFLDEKIGWLGDNNGRLVKSIDGGKTWCDHKPPDNPSTLPSHLVQIYFEDELNGWGVSYLGALHTTLDGGKSWQKLDLGIKVKDISILTRRASFLLAEDGFFLFTHNN